jgi:cell division protein FtsL
MKEKRILVLVFGVVGLLFLAKFLMANMLSGAGLKLTYLSEQSSQVSQENSFLSEEIVKLSSLSRISQEAQNLGLDKPSLVINLSSEVPVALR